MQLALNSIRPNVQVHHVPSPPAMGGSQAVRVSDMFEFIHQFTAAVQEASSGAPMCRRMFMCFMCRQIAVKFALRSGDWSDGLERGVGARIALFALEAGRCTRRKRLVALIPEL